MQAVASGTEEMSASIREIAQTSAEAARVAARATEVTRSTTAAVARLGASSKEIGDVVTVIAAIAEQIDHYQLTISTAVEEQTATTSEMGRGLAEAAAGSGQTAVNVVGVAEGARTPSGAVNELAGTAAAPASTAAESSQGPGLELDRMCGAVDEVARMSLELREQIAAFRF